MKAPFPLVLLLFSFSCGLPLIAEEKESAEEAPALWSPKVGDVWRYEVTMEVTREAEIPAGEQVQVRETADGIEIRYEREDRYLGTEKVRKDEESWDAMEVKRAGIVKSIDYLQIVPEAVFGRASREVPENKGEEGEKEGRLSILAKPLLMVAAKSKAGDEWKVAGPENEDGVVLFKRHFRCFGLEKVKVPAGEFEALRFEVIGVNGSIDVHREYWFVPQLGFIKEEKSYYSANQKLLEQKIELKKFLPAEAPQE
ncbi:MAG: hypothetical protein ACQKBY_07665 [Verrucomicrobiales bacterium]